MAEIKNHLELEKVDQDFSAWTLINDGKTEIVRVHLEPGEFIDTHINPLVVIFFILAGTGTLTVDGDTFNLKKDDAIRVEKGLSRKWHNTAEESLEFLVIKQL